MTFGVWNRGATGVDGAEILKAFRTVDTATGRRPSTNDLARIYGVEESVIANALARAIDAEYERGRREED